MRLALNVASREWFPLRNGHERWDASGRKVIQAFWRSGYCANYGCWFLLFSAIFDELSTFAVDGQKVLVVFLRLSARFTLDAMQAKADGLIDCRFKRCMIDAEQAKERRIEIASEAILWLHGRCF